MASQDWLEKDFYAVLGVEKTITDADLKRHYRKLARKYHPDSTQGDPTAEAKFKEISEAYSVLSDPDQRAQYDQIHAMGAGGPRFATSSSGGFEDLFGGQRTGGASAGAGFEDILSGLFGGGFRQSSNGYSGFGMPQRGSDLSAETTVTFAQAVTGDTMKMDVLGRKITARIPAGVRDGQTLRFKGKGQAGQGGADPGDLLIKVRVASHPVFEIDGINLRITVPVKFTEAALGATIEVPKFGGGVAKLKLAPGTPSGRVLRVKGQGIRTPKGVGDLLATVQIVVPGHMSQQAEAALTEFQKLEPSENPRDDLIRDASAQ